MANRRWEDLPDGVRAAVESRTGPVVEATTSAAGRSFELSTTLHLAHGRVFCKGILSDNPKAWTHHNEVRVNPLLPHGLGPRLLWEIDTAGWLLSGYEFVSGQHADLSPGSPDLPHVATALSAIGKELAPRPVALRWLSENWRRTSPWRRIVANIPDDLDLWERQNVTRFAEWESEAIRFMDGDNLVHSDLHPLNILVSDRARIVDWAWACRGAAWVDPALLVIRLIGAGHSPHHAEEWASQVPTWSTAPEAARTAFSVAVLGMWEYRGRRDPAPRWARLTEAVRHWVRYRLEQAP